MIRLCNDCWYLYEAGSTSRCPDCGSSNCRPANVDEIHEYYRSTEPHEESRSFFDLAGLFGSRRNRVPLLCGLNGISFAD